MQARTHQVFRTAALESTGLGKGTRAASDQKAVVGSVHHRTGYAHRVGHVFYGSLVVGANKSESNENEEEAWNNHVDHFNGYALYYKR